MEITIDAKPIYTVKICEKCSCGHMMVNDHESLPFKQHRCTECGHKEMYPISYPAFSYTYDPEDIENEIEAWNGRLES
jgi:hypothetical protein